MKFKSLIIFGMIGTLPTSGYSSGTGAHGGGAFVCQDQATSEYLSAESQDLWEIVHVNGLSLIDVDPAMDEVQLSRALIQRIEGVQPELYARVSEALDYVLREQKHREDLAIEEIGDNKRRYSKATCEAGLPKFVYAAEYNDTPATPDKPAKNDKLIYAEKVWRVMKTKLDRAALNAHEAIYKVLRKFYGDKDSIRTRLIVGYLASQAGEDALFEVLPALKFNPASDQSYDEKRLDLLHRFELAGLPKPQPGSGTEMRACSVLGADTYGDIPREIPLGYLEFRFDREGNYRAVHSRWNGEFETRTPFKTQGNQLSAIYYDRSDSWGYKMNLREEANGDLLVQREDGHLKCGFSLTCWGKKSVEPKRTRYIAHCPKPVSHPQLSRSGAPGPRIPGRLHPLAGSEWARVHPGLLPYESCRIKSGDRRFVYATERGLIAGDIFDNVMGEPAVRGYSRGYFLTCEAPKLGVVFSIPIEFEGATRRGLNLNLIGADIISKGLAVGGLNGKRLGDFFGDFKGAGFAVGPIATRYIRNHGIGINIHALGILLGFSLGYERMTFNALAQVTDWDCANAKILTSADTSAERDATTCALSSEKSTSMDWIRSSSVDTVGMSNLKFVKVK